MNMKVVVKPRNAFEVRSEHLLAMVEYCYEQMNSSNCEIRVLDYADNENQLSGDEQLDYIAEIANGLTYLIQHGDSEMQGNSSLLVVKPSAYELDVFNNEL